MSDLDNTPSYVVVGYAPHSQHRLRPASKVCFASYDSALDWAQRCGPRPFFIVEGSRAGLLLANTGKHAKEVAKLPRGDDGKLTAFAWPGGYEVVYYHHDGETLCHKCANILEQKHGIQGGHPDYPITMFQTDETIEHWEQCSECNRVIVDWDDDKNERRETQETPTGP